MTIFLAMAALQIFGPDVPYKIDLTGPPSCELQPSTRDEIVVCANRRGESPYRLKQFEPKTTSALPAAQMQIAEGVHIAAEAENVNINGFPSNRAMVRLKIKF